jgi:hypothetical protein
MRLTPSRLPATTTFPAKAFWRARASSRLPGLGKGGIST